jgi:hypothetical protein
MQAPVANVRSAVRNSGLDDLSLLFDELLVKIADTVRDLFQGLRARA